MEKTLLISIGDHDEQITFGSEQCLPLYRHYSLSLVRSGDDEIINMK